MDQLDGMSTLANSYQDNHHQINSTFMEGVISEQLLTDDLGNPVTDTLSMTFNIYGAPILENWKWTEAHPSVIVTNGLFSVLPCSTTPIDDSFFNDQGRYPF
jgi:hypothetical protein